MHPNKRNWKRGDGMAWKDLDASVTCLFDLYMARLDPFERYAMIICINFSSCHFNFTKYRSQLT